MKVLFSLLAILAIAMPSMAAVTINVTTDGDTATVSYTSDAGDEPCAFALDVTPASTVATTAAAVSTNFNVYIDSANTVGATGVEGANNDGDGVYDIGEGTPWANVTAAGEITDLSAGFCFSAASLGNGLIASDTLFTVTGSGDYTIGLNSVRGGVVKAGEAPAVDVTILVDGVEADTFSLSAGSTEPYIGADVDEWISLGRPNGWLSNTQCFGDADNAAEPYGWGTVRVGLNDLDIFIAGFRQAYHGSEAAGVPAGEEWISADFDHLSEPYGWGTVRVGLNDLDIFIANFRQSVAATCGQVAE